MMMMAPKRQPRLYSLYRRLRGTKAWVRVDGAKAYTKDIAVQRFQSSLLDSALGSAEQHELRIRLLGRGEPELKGNPSPSPGTTLKVWPGPQPETCNLCGGDLKAHPYWVDGRTNRGPWATMCKPCHERHGVGFGLGQGTAYASPLKVEEKLDGQ